MKECCIKAQSFENACNSALKLLDENGGLNPATRKTAFARSFNGKNPAAGKEIGFTGKTYDGRPVFYRVDFDEVKGSHINLVIGKGTKQISNAYIFPGNQQQYLNILKVIQN